MSKYRVEVRIDKENFYRVDCSENDLNYYKILCKYDSVKNGGVCFYRKFPLCENKKVFYAKDNPKLTKEELEVVLNKLKGNMNMHSVI